MFPPYIFGYHVCFGVGDLSSPPQQILQILPPYTRTQVLNPKSITEKDMEIRFNEKKKPYYIKI